MRRARISPNAVFRSLWIVQEDPNCKRLKEVLNVLVGTVTSLTKIRRFVTVSTFASTEFPIPFNVPKVSFSTLPRVNAPFPIKYKDEDALPKKSSNSLVQMWPDHLTNILVIPILTIVNTFTFVLEVKAPGGTDAP